MTRRTHPQHQHAKPPTLPALKGGLLALLAAALFGISTPLVQLMGAGLGAFTTAALLYGGAALMGAALRQPVQREAGLRLRDLPRLAWMALFGAAIGPVALAWGLQHTSGTSASLMLALEALFTALLARMFYGEVMDRRVWTAMGLLLAGGLVLVVDRALGATVGFVPVASAARVVGMFSALSGLLGLLAVLVATAAWGVDNTLSRALAERDPGQVVLAKSLMGVAATALLAVAASEPMPPWTAALALLAIGGCGYGLSLRLYLLAQRAFGAARTGSVFAFAPFIGALLAIALGDRSRSLGMALGGGLMLAGILLHLAERHAHPHVHAELDHEHAHRHDDGHHEHTHMPMPVGEHSHPHRHTPTSHSHAHVPDAHHAHTH